MENISPSTTYKDKLTSDNNKGLQVIAAGLFRNGTLSLKKAFEILGYGKCYHMWEFFSNPSHAKVWNDAADNKENIDWDSLFEGYHSASDNPIAIHIDKLIKKYPNAKVILNMRDPEEWYESSLKTVFDRNHDCTKIFPHYKYCGDYFYSLIDNNPYNKENMIKFYQDHLDFVRKVVPKENLLDNYNVKQGWKPICDFLGKDIPLEDFPKVNDTEGYFKALETFSKELKDEEEVEIEKK